MKGGWLIFCLGMVPSMALASFELLVTADDDGWVYRYDLQNNVYLGSFRNFQIPNAVRMTADSSTSTIYLAQSNGKVHRLNYFTGAYGGFIQTPMSDITGLSLLNNGKLLMTGRIGGGAVTRAYDPVSGALAGALTYTSGDFPIAAFQLSDGTFVSSSAAAAAGSNYNFYKNRHGTLGNLLGSTALLTAVPTTRPLEGFAVVGTQFLAWGTTLSGLQAGSVALMDIDGTTALPIDYNSALGINHIGYSAGTTHSGTVVMTNTYDRTLNSEVFLNYHVPGSGTIDIGPNVLFRTDYISTTIGAHVVNAPEPASMAALGVGALALLRRRKKV